LPGTENDSVKMSVGSAVSCPLSLEEDSSTFWRLIWLIQSKHLCWNTSPRSNCSKNN